VSGGRELNFERSRIASELNRAAVSGVKAHLSMNKPGLHLQANQLSSAPTGYKCLLRDTERYVFVYLSFAPLYVCVPEEPLPNDENVPHNLY
jgi:hypothetical protein